MDVIFLCCLLSFVLRQDGYELTVVILDKNSFFFNRIADTKKMCSHREPVIKVAVNKFKRLCARTSIPHIFFESSSIVKNLFV